MSDQERLAKAAADSYQQGDFVQTRDHLLALIDLGISSAALLNQLANVFVKLEDYAGAEQYYKKALKAQPDHIDAMYNLALVLKEQDKKEEAAASLVAILEVEPAYYPAHFLLGRLALAKNFVEKANHYFERAFKASKDNKALLQNIIAALLEKDAFLYAKFYCEKLAQLDAENTEAFYNLAVIGARQQNFDEAVQQYQKVLELNDKHFPALNNLAVIYLDQQNIEAAKACFERALAIQPKNEAIQYTLDAIGGNGQQGSAPRTYITNLFNQYAQHYDAHLRDGLAYRVPELLKDAIASVVDTTQPQWRILDLGCGTGLCGETFKDWSTELTGVDLAEKMLEMARAKDVYDELVQDDVEQYLKSTGKKFDNLLAADVFIYIGDLNAIFQHAHCVLDTRGYLAFSVELCYDKDFSLQKSGRFSHSEKYLKQLAADNGFQCLLFEKSETRMQRHISIDGAVVVLQKQHAS